MKKGLSLLLCLVLALAGVCFAHAEGADGSGITVDQAGVFFETENGIKCLVGRYADLSLLPAERKAGIYYTLRYSRNFPDGCEFNLTAPDGTVYQKRDDDLKDCEGQAYNYFSAFVSNPSELVPGEYSLTANGTLVGRFTIIVAGDTPGTGYIENSGPVTVLFAGIGVEKDGKNIPVPTLNVATGDMDPNGKYGLYFAVRYDGDQTVNLTLNLVGKGEVYTREVKYTVHDVEPKKNTFLFTEADISQLAGTYTLSANGREIYRFAIANE